MPPPLEDVSDSESTGDSIPFNSAAESKDRDVAMEDNDEDGDGEEEEEEEEEDMFIVDKIEGHEFAKNGALLLLVKWKDYEDPADRTYEPEENLEGAKDAVDEYYRKLGGRPQKPEPKKRKSMGGRPPKSAAVKQEKPEPKRQRKSRGAVEDEPAENNDTPNWMPKSKNWEKEVKSVETILRDAETDGLVAFLLWENGKKSKVSIEMCYDRCPRKMLQFYESHLVFKDES
ncbi:hypothetical protein P168DRAFT_305522 [Aspergillus campestris IBT 28561]|uniref:Chromo domain-containing protein n=1 Tax=Aspergillus campestris (strain IBT 28561) TaxID=1392248 RepID=A0A2I1CZZ4_ASPC2|nr:uncharacterized protein P168DRAFT_305522 [Aspergillus campestris IBT 28561]PKY03202.1 hypothetical protein P168DRAFT_305522 [Aspergillus campestris IBT 28561]